MYYIQNHIHFQGVDEVLHAFVWSSTISTNGMTATADSWTERMKCLYKQKLVILFPTIKTIINIDISNSSDIMCLNKQQKNICFPKTY